MIERKMGPEVLSIVHWANITVDDMDIQSVIDSWRWRCRKACKFQAF